MEWYYMARCGSVKYFLTVSTEHILCWSLLPICTNSLLCCVTNWEETISVKNTCSYFWEGAVDKIYTSGTRMETLFCTWLYNTLEWWNCCWHLEWTWLSKMQQVTLKIIEITNGYYRHHRHCHHYHDQASISAPPHHQHDHHHHHTATITITITSHHGHDDHTITLLCTTLMVIIAQATPCCTRLLHSNLLLNTPLRCFKSLVWQLITLTQKRLCRCSMWKIWQKKHRSLWHWHQHYHGLVSCSHIK